MKLVSKIIWGILFLIVFAVSLKNMDKEAVLTFFSGYELKGPLPLLLLGFVLIGFVLGVLAMTPAIFRHRRDLSRYKKTIDTMQKEHQAQQVSIQPPAPDTIVGA